MRSSVKYQAQIQAQFKVMNLVKAKDDQDAERVISKELYGDVLPKASQRNLGGLHDISVVGEVLHGSLSFFEDALDNVPDPVFANRKDGPMHAVAEHHLVTLERSITP